MTVEATIKGMRAWMVDVQNNGVSDRKKCFVFWVYSNRDEKFRILVVGCMTEGGGDRGG